ncbi:MAG: TauD/TfdA family dioxygenase [Brevirhabdus sp.]
MARKDVEIQDFNWIDLGSDQGYAEWRDHKIARVEKALLQGPVELKTLADPSESERAELMLRCRNTNFAWYSSPETPCDSEKMRISLRTFAKTFGLSIAEAHRSAEDGGIVALRVTEAAKQAGFIPYSNRAMNWHTDGYYNAPANRISAFVLHCVEQAASGGTNDLLDQEVIYIRLREHNPAYLAALMHPEAMSIPENTESDGSVRPVSVGPVFYPDPATGRMQMRYTARTRSISWRDDKTTLEAEAWLRDYLAQGDPLAMHVRLQAGQGVLNNNVLHNRTGFDNSNEGGTRLIYRVRFSNRVGGL